MTTPPEKFRAELEDAERRAGRKQLLNKLVLYFLYALLAAGVIFVGYKVLTIQDTNRAILRQLQDCLLQTGKCYQDQGRRTGGVVGQVVTGTTTETAQQLDQVDQRIAAGFAAQGVPLPVLRFITSPIPRPSPSP